MDGLSLQNLNTLAIMLDKKVNEAPKKSFIEELPAEKTMMNFGLI